MTELTCSLEQLQDVCQAIVDLLPEGGVVILRGDLAAGKTTLTQAFAKHLGLSEAVTSPTFSLQQCYGDRLFHYDIYNQGMDHFLSLGMLEELEREGYHLVEWGDESLARLLKTAGIPMITVVIDKADKNRRTYRIEDA
ncbi:tRNA (adenosine(37)-N6)-threonylcarbamoyltransferase complex ATPase subunit type 1 TsaE [Sulfurimonas sp. HSL3-7]|uniref:tRNA (adenosine(37)-N6)-threonylcarbamoyltransferase complex ATPase subunit type 1 TsaE n=1 Tax=Sulfonitrofixus jiaomeiensis TaxID=3131938 RepID=UPI0031F72D9C